MGWDGTGGGLKGFAIAVAALEISLWRGPASLGTLAQSMEM